MRVLIIVLVVGLSGCAAEWNVVKKSASGYGAEIADEALQAKIWSICNVTTMGAYQRNIAGDSQRAMGYAALCASSWIAPVMPGSNGPQ